MNRDYLPLAPEFIVDTHARFNQPEDSPLHDHLMDMLTELRERYFVLSHSGCSGRTPNPKIEFGQGYVLLDQIQFPSWLDEGRDCHLPLKIVDWENRYAYVAWSQSITQHPMGTPAATVVDEFNTPVTFRGKTIPLIEVAFNGFLGSSDANVITNNATFVSSPQSQTTLKTQ